MPTTKILGEGLLSWPSHERVSDRYGAVTLTAVDGNRTPLGAEVEGQHGTLVAEVLETRESMHVGDFFRGFSPSTPSVGDRIVLGTGTVFLGDYGSVGLSPDDGRDADWLDPHALYRAHDQTVRLLFEPAEAVS